ncbi:Do family serine endopeptidase [Reyranella sp. CPCC 100927]|uniref:Do family serine endopeptidase n=1 Tax=Reyranella sp. CPCC 100927 TaxID=2599616 RepID=UPI0011B81598|nr:Do family serine endopeptidase [Reyranella sp. CPCC 100927]TWT05709.1 Do family serine endopeptidase [Reyranella sp. CPCC 100927]
MQRNVLAALFLAAGLAAPALALAQTLPANREQMQLSFAPLVKRASPAVVNIYTKTRIKTQRPSFLDDPVFRRFFGDDYMRGLPRERVQNALGSGVVLRAHGLIVTNAHVVRNADEIQIVFADKREFPAKVVIQDDRYDLAVLRVEAGDERLPFLELRDSDTVEVGDLVLAIGNPFGLQQTVTSGIISAIARSGGSVTESGFFLQTDAAINPGNSGGALLGLDGRLVGINTAIYSNSGGSVGIGFATPSNIVARIVEAAEKGTRLTRPWLGIGVQRVTSDLAQSLGMARPQGVIIRAVAPDSPAARAGLKVGDVLLTINDQPVDDESALRFRLSTQAVDSTIRARVTRKGQEETYVVKVTAPPELPPRERTQLTGRQPLTGVTVMNMSPAVADELAIEPGQGGVIVAEVPQGVFAAQFLKAGDYIVGINGREVDSVATLRTMVGTQPDRWSVSVRRDGQVRTFNFRG